MKVKISDIAIKERIRENLGDISKLATSISDLGLLHPPAVKPDNSLVAGYRRLVAARDVLKWEEIEVTVVNNINDLLAALKAERDENVCRLDFNPIEAVKAGLAIEPLEREAAKNRQRSHNETGYEKFTDPAPALDRVAAAVGMSRPTYTKAKEIVAAAEANPDLLFLVDELKTSGKVDSVHKKLNKLGGGKKKKKKNKDVDVESPPPSPPQISLLHGDMITELSNYPDSFDLVIADPPYNVTDWDWDKIGSSAEFLRETRAWLKAIKPALKSEYNLFWFCSPQFSASIERLLIRLGFPIQSRIVWHRRNMAKGSHAKNKFIDTWEMIFHCGNRPLNFPDQWGEKWFDVQIFAVPQTNSIDTKLHPTQKPVELINRLVNFGSYPGDKVLDPFAGSGTTGEACQNINRDCLLIEKEVDFCNIIKLRLGIKENE